MEKRIIKINEIVINYYLERKKIKNINIRIKQDGNIYLSCPIKMKLEDIEKVLIQKSCWIIKQQMKLKKYYSEKEQYEFKNGGKVYLLGKLYELIVVPSKSNFIEIMDTKIKIYVKENYIQNTEYIKRYYERYLKEKAFDMYINLVKKYQKEMSKYVKSFPQIQIKKLKTRWGSCTPGENKVTFNLSLIKAPIECIEYVVVHELAHFKYQNHSKNFYNIVELYIPDWKERRKLLNRKYSILV